MHPAHAHNTAAVQNQCSTVRDSMQSATAAWRVASCWFVRLVCNGHAVAVRYTTLSTINMSSQIPGCPAEHAPHSWPCRSAEHVPIASRLNQNTVPHCHAWSLTACLWCDHLCTVSASCFPDLLGGTARNLRRPACNTATPAPPCRNGPGPCRPKCTDTPALTQPL